MYLTKAYLIVVYTLNLPLDMTDIIAKRHPEAIPVVLIPMSIIHFLLPMSIIYFDLVSKCYIYTYSMG